MRRRLTRIGITDHALERYRQRAGAVYRRELANEVRRRLLPALRLRVYPDEYGAVHLPLEGGLVAIVMPSLLGGWDVLTVYRIGEFEEVAA